MTFDIDPKVIIKEVKKRSPLYDTKTKQYHDRKLKQTLWNEVCQRVYTASVWDSLSSQEKNVHGKEVQKKWSSLRHSFRREIAAHKNLPPGSSTKKRKYIYFDDLLFLLPFTEGSVKFEELDGNNSENETDSIKGNDSEDEPSSSKSGTTKINNEGEIIRLLKESNLMLCNLKTYGHDEDELFFRSLIPSMKEFTGDQKLFLRMEIIKLILNFKQSFNAGSTSPQMNDTSEISPNCDMKPL